MASCYLLEMLEGRESSFSLADRAPIEADNVTLGVGNDPKAGKPYGSAFVSHLRSLLDSDDPAAPKVMNMSLGWSALMMREAIFAASAGRTSHLCVTLLLLSFVSCADTVSFSARQPTTDYSAETLQLRLKLRS